MYFYRLVQHSSITITLKEIKLNNELYLILLMTLTEIELPHERKHSKNK